MVSEKWEISKLLSRICCHCGWWNPPEDFLSPKTCSVVGCICLNHADEIKSNRSTVFSLNTGARTACLTPQSVFVPWKLSFPLLLFGENIFDMKRYWRVTHLQPANDRPFGNLCKNTDFWKATQMTMTPLPSSRQHYQSGACCDQLRPIGWLFLKGFLHRTSSRRILQDCKMNFFFFRCSSSENVGALRFIHYLRPQQTLMECPSVTKTLKDNSFVWQLRLFVSVWTFLRNFPSFFCPIFITYFLHLYVSFLVRYPREFVDAVNLSGISCWQLAAVTPVMIRPHFFACVFAILKSMKYTWWMPVFCSLTRISKKKKEEKSKPPSCWRDCGKERDVRILCKTSAVSW